MHQDKLGGIKERIILHRLLGISVAGLAVFLLVFTLASALTLEASAAEDISVSIAWAPVIRSRL